MIRRRILAGALTAVMALCTLSGCGAASNTGKTASSETTDIADVGSEKYALILSDGDSTYENLIADAFRSTMKKAGKKYEIRKPAESPAANQEKFVETLTKDKVSAIAIDPADADSMKEDLKVAMDSGIRVISYDAPADPKTRDLHISQTSQAQIAATLLDAVLDLSSGTGEWAMLSSSSTAAKQNGWIDEIRKTMKESKYKDLQLMEIAYGDEQYQKSYDQTKALLQNYPDLKVICVPTTNGIQAAAAAVKDAGSSVKVTGFGLPSEMKDYIGTDNVVPYMYLWNPKDMGRLIAYVSVALSENKLEVKNGEKFKAGSMGEFEITKADDGGLEVIVGSPYKFDESNIEEWAKEF